MDGIEVGEMQISEDAQKPLKDTVVKTVNTCVACLGLLQNGVQDEWLDRVWIIYDSTIILENISLRSQI